MRLGSRGSNCGRIVLNHQFVNGGSKDIAGYARAALRGFGTGSLFGVAGTKLSALATSRLPVQPVYPAGWNPRLLAPNVQRWTTTVSEIVNHGSGAVQGAVNQWIRPGADASRTGILTAATQGFFLGAKGPVSGMPRAP